jgi:hypothetical protein
VSQDLATKAEPPDVGDVFDNEDEQQRLEAIVGEQYTRMLRALHALVLQRFPDADLSKVENFRLDDAATRRILHYSATRVVRITETTRAAIAEQLAIGQALGLSTWEIANGVADIDYRGIDGLFSETWRGRAETVARTELQEAQRVSAIDRYHATGLVDRVELADGDDWDEVCRGRHGKVVPLEQAPGLAHPRCTLVLIPVLREGVV